MLSFDKDTDMEQEKMLGCNAVVTERAAGH